MLLEPFVSYRWETHSIKEVYIFILPMLKLELLNNDRGKRWSNTGWLMHREYWTVIVLNLKILASVNSLKVVSQHSWCILSST